MYVVQASPISKIYAREWEQKCINEPELINQSAPGLFELRIKRPSGGIVLSHMKPVHASSLIKRTSQVVNAEGKVVPAGTTREIEEDEITPLVAWLTEHESTDPYGVVAVDVGHSFESALQEILSLSLEGSNAEARKRQSDIQKDIVSTMASQLKTARTKADERVKKALSVTHSNLINSWQTMAQDGKGQYPPSACEALGYAVLKTEIDKRLEQNRKLFNSVAEGMPGARRA